MAGKLKFFILFCLISCQIFAEDSIHESFPSSSLASTTGLISTLANDSVCVITGEYVDAAEDILLAGPLPLKLKRFYSSHDDSRAYLYNGWQLSQPDTLTMIRNRIQKLRNQETFVFSAALSESSGAKLHYASEQCKIEHYIPFIPAKGLTNCGSGQISARTNLNNQKLWIDPEKKAIRVDGAAGDKRYFAESAHSSNGLNRRYNFLLQDHKFLNGQRYGYAYDGKLKEIHATSANCAHVYSWLRFDYLIPNETTKQLHVTTSDGRKVQYDFQLHRNLKGKPRYYLNHVDSPEKAPEFFYYEAKPGSDYLRVVRKEKPEGRFQDIEYYKSGQNALDHLSMISLEETDFRVGRVKQQKAPVGPHGELITTHRFVYHQQTTEVFDAHHHKIDYHYNENHQLLAIQKFKGTLGALQPYFAEHFRWHDSLLIGKFITDAQGTVLSGRFFGYDPHGNVNSERFYGNLTGNAPPVVIGNHHYPIQGESYGKQYAYSQDGWNLLLTETEDNGKSIDYAYKADSDLIITRLISDHGHVRLREFFDYNETGVLVKKILDDGCSEDRNHLSGVTERHVIHIKPRMTAPVGVPECEEHCTVDLATGQEILNKRILSSYSIEGRLLKQDYYDSNGVYCYSLHWEYDSHGNVLTEIDALGQTIHRQYDIHDNLIYEQGPSSLFYTVYSYDPANRNVRKEEIHQGNRFVTCYEYDALGNQTASIDSFGSRTQYEYDEFGRIIRTIHEAAIIATDYDIEGNPTTEIGPRGEITRKQYNSRGKPTQIIYPNGSQQQFLYNLDGTLQQEVDTNGIITRYTYDFLGRITSTEIYDSTHTLLSRSSATYNSFHLISSVDPEGLVTQCTYNCKGELISKASGSHCTHYTYDTLGRVAIIEEVLFPSSKYTLFSYDLLNRVIEEIVKSGTELVRSVKYTYDALGNRTAITTEGEAGTSIARVQYDGRSHPIMQIDALGNTTYIKYICDYYNQAQQNVLQIIVTDPLGNNNITTYDTLGREKSIIKKDAFGSLLAQQDNSYDLSGNCTQVIQHSIEQGESKRQSIVQCQYNQMNQLISQVEAVGTPEQRTTTYAYYPSGERSVLYKPDGVQLHYSYDAHGRLEQLISSDKSVHQTFAYNKNHQVILAQDDHTTTQRAYDQYGNMVHEQLGNQLRLAYSYDALNRPSIILLPDHSRIEYFYNATNLKEVSHSINGEPLYTHTYQKHDLTGALTQAILPGNAGQLRYQYDLCGRPIKISSKTNQTYSYDSIGNLIEEEIQGKPVKFSYDSLYQLTQEKGSQTHSYSFDSLNNRLNKNHIPHQNNALNQLIQHDQCQYSYDPNGNLIEKTETGKTTHYQYDALDRLIQVTQGAETTTYTYDPFNRRLSKTTQQDKTDYLYQDQNEIGAFQQGVLVQLRILGEGAGAEIGATIAIELNKQVYVPLHNNRGDIISLLDLEGNPVEHYQFTAFGEEQIFDSNNNEVHTSTVGNPWRYSSKRHDDETGLIYFGRRYYAPEIGRWITQDPIGYDDGPNLYAYLRNNPLTNFDLYGLAVDMTNPSIHDRAPLAKNPRSHAAANQGRDKERSFYQKSVDFASRTLENPHVRGALQCIGGLAEIGAGNSFAYATAGFGAALGFSMMGHGMDQVITGMQTLLSGQTYESATSQILQKAGLSEETAEFLDSGASLCASVGSRLIIQGISKLTLTSLRAMPINNLRLSSQRLPNFRLFTKANSRHNLMQLTGESPLGNIHAHHVFPQRHSNFFTEKGINLHHPKYMTWWEGKSHLQNAKSYNVKWKDFIDKNPNATKIQILEEGKKMMKNYNMDVHY